MRWLNTSLALLAILIIKAKKVKSNAKNSDLIKILVDISLKKIPVD